MAKYTVTIHDLMKVNWTFPLTSYPIWEESYRDVLNQHILSHFEFREIGFETPGLFNNRLAVKLNEIMPYANGLYKLNMDKLFSFDNQDVEETTGRHSNRNDTGTGENSSHSTGNTDSTSDADTKNREVNSDLPQFLVQVEDIEGDMYASQARIADGTSHQTGTSDSTADSNGNYSTEANSTFEENVLKRIKGGTGYKYPYEIFRELYSSFMTVESWIFEQLDDLFMQVY